MSCVAYGCTNASRKKIPGVRFHRFPKDETLRKRWISAIRRKDWTPGKYAVICSEHFEESDFDRTSPLRVELRPNTVPSVFKGFPKHLQKLNLKIEEIAMPHCVAVNCKNNPRKRIPGISFHRFPENEALRQKWIRAVRRVNWVPSKGSVLCSSHFDDAYIDRTLTRVHLINDAVPTKFNYSSYSYKPATQRRTASPPPESNSSSPDASQDGLDFGTTEAGSSLGGNTLGNTSSHSTTTPRLIHVNAIPASKLTSCGLTPKIIDALGGSKVQLVAQGASAVPSSSSCDSPPPSVAPAPTEVSLQEVLNRKLKEVTKNYGEESPSSYIVRVPPSDLETHPESTVPELRAKLAHALRQLTEARKRVKILQQKNRRQSSKIILLGKRIRSLEGGRSSSDDALEGDISESEVYQSLFRQQQEAQRMEGSGGSSEE